ncbi:MAG: alpha/beta hydrolase [Planctomycetales bacterium]|nr:alpha/beta hydrolase [Planctomycetales bacterium]
MSFRSNFPHSMVACLLLWAIMLPDCSAADDMLFFREDWKETPAALPITSQHVANSALRMETHGPGRLGIKKSHHVEIENDPFYVWSGECRGSWALSLRKNGFLADLSVANARVRWRSRQSGDHALHLLIKLPGERWFISEQSDSGQQWHEHTFVLRELTWRHFSIITAKAEEKVETPDFDRVEQIGFSDQQPGRGTPSSSRVDWVEVYGIAVKAPKNPPPAVAAKPVQPELPAGVNEYLGLVYAKYGQRELTLDLYQPSTGNGPFPAVVFIHGGGWYKGDPSSYTAMAQQLAARGYVTLNIFYRLSGEAPFPAAIFDCKSAVRWARAHSASYQIDPARIGSVGGSAGGHLSGLLGTSGHVAELNQSGIYLEQSSAIQACVVMAGSMDLTSTSARESAASDPRRRLITFMHGTWEEAHQNYVAASPVSHVSEQTPPMMFMDGEFDSPGTRYTEIITRLDELGIYHESHVIPNGPHPFWSSHPFFEPALDLVAQFFDRTLKN